MKKINSWLFASFFLIYLFPSCQSYDSKLDSFLERYLRKAEPTNIALLEECYPASLQFTGVSIPSNLDITEYTVEKDTSENKFIVTLEADSKMQLFVEQDKTGKYIIYDSYGYMTKKKEAQTIIEKTGIPSQHLTDKELSDVFDPSNGFIPYLLDKHKYELDQVFVEKDRIFNWDYPATYNISMVNNTTKNIEEGEYGINVKASNPETDFVYYERFFDGKDLKPGEVIELVGREGDDYRMHDQLSANDINVYTEVYYYICDAERIAKYADLHDFEYTLFLEHQKNDNAVSDSLKSI